MSQADDLKNLALPPSQYAIFGSGPMAIRGIREANDIDLIVKKDLWDDLAVRYSSLVDGYKIVINGIEIFHSWKDIDINLNELIDTADVFNGVRYVKLENVIKWKENLKRPKDIEDIKLIRAYLDKES